MSTDARPRSYNIQKEDIEGMMRSGVPNETVTAKLHRWPTPIDGEVGVMGWLIEVTRMIYGEEYVHHSFVTLKLVQAGPEWVEEQQRIIDVAFEKTRLEHPKAMH